MIRAINFYHVVEATVPLYVAMMLAYICVKYFKLFSAEQCAGINKFVAKFSVPLLAFNFISKNNPYKMNLKLICADFLQKLLALLALGAATKFGSRTRGHLTFVVTGFSLLTLPNTLILGIPLMKGMYGGESQTLLTQIVMLQSLIWNNVLLFLFELNAAKQASEVMPAEAHPQESGAVDQLEEGVQGNRREKAKTMYILMEVGKKLILNPNTHAALFGLILSCITFRWKVKLPKIVQGSIDTLADGGLGMAMFSLGLFMATRGRIIACGIRLAMVAMAMRFLVSPALMAAPSFALRLKGTLLRVAIVQAALPQGIVPFVFAMEYNVHPDILSTGVLFGMLVAVPVSLLYYLLLGL